ncbi:DNA polymerase III subunit chi [Pseudoroseomonas ludipueritiae]|uniref:DNA polymerase III subunit chi n=1 Tax=Pseudoroseomonas ludipueritiae TaxID=198093 RepID=A0ABR7RFJ1_9PROT|nr:DNA polymerase III subunit chi [Pseudoroseomonas ludipueritiae]MBC9180195.1 DNA polymerase III subunit chi [Pseudoroseomonas ludipueritiae]MCG7362592.1 DNA polymerase III subunit chi [Roseomonas sp. ACRSG]
MSEIGFYHLTRTPMDQALPKLLGRVLAQGARAVVRVGEPERLAALDSSLWLCQDPDWLPHGTPQTGQADLQPIWLTTEDEAPNGARFLFLVDGADSARLGEFDRVFDLFDGQDDAAVAAARRRWSAAKAAGHVLTYWQQGARGWEKKA